MKRTSSFIISFLLLISAAAAQDRPGVEIPADTSSTGQVERPRRIDTIPWERSGLRVGIDLLKPILSFVDNQPQGGEFSLDYEVKKNYFGVIEGGWQQMELDELRYNYTTDGIFGRLGVDYNFMRRRKRLSTEIAYAGFRYGFSSFHLQADSVLLSGGYWGDLLTSVPQTSLKAHWVEALLGVKAEIFDHFSLGWTVRAGFLVSSGLTKREVVPIRVPGYGKTEKKPVFGFTYSVFYRF